MQGQSKTRGSRRAPFPTRLLAGLLSIWLASALPGITGGAPPAEKIPVAASILPLGDFCRQIGGDLVLVQVLIPPGASPHAFEPSPVAVSQALQARAFIYVGAGLDPWAERLLKSRDTRGRVAVEAVRGLALLAGEEHPRQEPAPPREAPSRGNPHVWLDPVLAMQICRQIAAALVQVDPAHRQVYEANLNRYLSRLKELHQEIQQRVAAFRLREYVCFHPAFAYFARRYHLREVGVIEASPGREPTPRQIQELVAAIRRYSIPVVFAEPQFNPRVAEVIAREAGVKVRFLDPLGGRPPYGGDYLKLMRYNLTIMGEAMG